MGVNNHAFNFLGYAAAKKPLGDVLSLGRVGFHVARRQTRDLFTPVGAEYFDRRDGEKVLRDFFGASRVDALDMTDFEGAQIQHDLNVPLPDAHRGRYDTVLDLGTSEHVYNLPQVFLNVTALAKPGGQILHMLPANGQCGHGFWQFSPELFFSLYAQKNGYAETEVFLADNAAPRRWIAAQRPRRGTRLNLRSATPVFALVRTVVGEGPVSHQSIQQSDYEEAWETGRHDPKAAAISRSKWATAQHIAGRIGRAAEIIGHAFHYDMAQWQRAAGEVDPHEAIARAQPADPDL